MLLQITIGLLESLSYGNEIIRKDLSRKIERVQDYLQKLNIFVDNPYEDEEIPSQSHLFLLPDEILTFVFPPFPPSPLLST